MEGFGDAKVATGYIAQTMMDFVTQCGKMQVTTRMLRCYAERNSCPAGQSLMILRVLR